MQPSGRAANTRDDSNPAVFPGAQEVCADGLNTDCNHPAWPDLIALGDYDGDGDNVFFCAGDCDDSRPEIFPGAVEINDGMDNQCSGDAGFGLVDELTGTSGFNDPAQPELFSWPPQAGASLYQVARAEGATFAGNCTTLTVSVPQWSDPQNPSPGSLFFYLSRAFAPNLGSWGRDSASVERTVDCP